MTNLLLPMMSGLILRLLLLGSKSLWLDEVQALRVARAGIAQLWAGTVELYHPPLYYLLLSAWSRLGDDEFTLRLFSALLGVLNIALLYALARRLLGAGAGGSTAGGGIAGSGAVDSGAAESGAADSGAVAASAAWLAALSPLLIWYDQEVRSYALLTSLGLAALLGVVALSRRPGIAAWLVFTAATTAALYTHYMALFFLPLQLGVLLYLLIARRGPPLALAVWLAGVLAAGAALLPWLVSPVAQRFLSLALSDGSYAALLLAGATGLSLRQLLPIGVLLALAAPAGIAWAAARWRATIFTAFNRLRQSPLLQAGAVLCFVLLLAAVVFPRGYSLKRQLVAFWPLVLLGFAWLWPWQRAHSDNHRRRVLLAGVLSLSLAAALVNIILIPKDDWRSAAAHILQAQAPGDAILAAPVYLGTPLGYYSAGELPIYGASASSPHSELPARLAEHGRLWLVTQAGEIHDAPGRAAVQGWLQSNAQRVSSAQFYGGITVELYAQP